MTDGKTVLEMVVRYRDGDMDAFSDIVEKMNPLLNHYARKLYSWEIEDAKQEMILALLVAVQRIKYCHSEGECIRYLETCIYRAYKQIIKTEEKKNYKTEWETEYISDGRDVIGLCEYYMDLEIYLGTLDLKKRKITEYIMIDGKSDKEIAERFSVSRQYINRIRRKLRNMI